ncbi:MAG: hypothetical protein Q9187_002929, partial [Circinaria calcarea]
MDYAQYQPSHGQQHHSTHLQGGYQNSQQPPPSSITSPPNHHAPHIHQQHPNHQASPILPSQGSQYQPQPPQSHQPPIYNPQYGIGPPSMQQPYGITPGQAAAAMATAAAAGPSYHYMPQTSMADGLARGSPHMAGVNNIKPERAPRSPPQLSNQMPPQMPPLPSQVPQVHGMPPQRRMSHN